MDVKCPNQPKERKFVQVLYREQAGQEYAKDPNRPEIFSRNGKLRLKQRTSAQGQVGQRDARDADSRRSRKPIRSRHVSPAEKGRGSPFRVDRRILSREVLGHPGQKDAVDAKEPADPRTNQIMTRVTRRK
ncbi:hypothetical protein KI387_004484, partial [Taxus chinensis]